MPPDTIDPKVHARRWRTLAVLALSLLVIGLDNTVLNVALPTLQSHFAASGTTLQWIVDAYLLSFAGVLLTMGTLGDRFGRKRALQSGLMLFGVASVAAAFAQNADQLIVLRALMGIGGVGGAMIMPGGWTDSLVLGCFAAAAGLAALCAAWERRVAAPMLPLRFFGDRRFTVASASVGLIFFAMMGSVFAFTHYLRFAHAPWRSGGNVRPAFRPARSLTSGRPRNPPLIRARAGTSDPAEGAARARGPSPARSPAASADPRRAISGSRAGVPLPVPVRGVPRAARCGYRGGSIRRRDACCGTAGATADLDATGPR